MANGKDSRCTVFISSCDKYADLWEPFFLLFKKYWPDCPYEVALISESKPFQTEGLDVRCMRCSSVENRNIPWGLLTMCMLDRIETEYVLFMLDDFFISEPVDQAMITRCLDWMDADPMIGRFMLKPISIGVSYDSPYPPFRMVDIMAKYRVVAHAALWRRRLLRSLIMPFEDPWFWENVAGKRSLKHPEAMYHLDIRFTDYAAIHYPPVGVVEKGILTDAGLKLLSDNGIPNTLAWFRQKGARKPSPSRLLL